MDYLTNVYTVTDDDGNEIECDAIIVNSEGAWAGQWYDDGSDHVTYDGVEYIPAPDGWETMIAGEAR